LCRDLGLQDRLVEASPAAARNRYLFVGGKLRLVPGSFSSFVGSDLLSWRGKLSLLCERFRRRKADDADESIDAFARRRAGTEVAEVFADALVTGIYAGDPQLLSLPACFPRVAALEREHGSVSKGMGAAARERRRQARRRNEVYRRPGALWSCVMASAHWSRLCANDCEHRRCWAPTCGMWNGSTLRGWFAAKDKNAGKPTPSC
jgi:oxygen-dependent protoporphyrinogen oxidase